MANQVAVVTGGNGFVGQCLVRYLLQAGNWKVVILDIQPEARFSREDKEAATLLQQALHSGRAHYYCGDLRNAAQVDQALQGAHVVFHVASPPAHLKDPKLFHDVNVVGTQSLIDACVKIGVKKLVFTSSASVVFNGTIDIKNGDESLPYPEKPLDAYTGTKAQAEQLVLSANGKGGLLTCALRPSGIFGPGDAQMLPVLVAQAQKGKTKAAIGDGKNLWDFTYVDNVAHAHLCAEKALQEGKEGDDSAAGKAFFVTNGEPMSFWDFTFAQLQALGYDGPMVYLPGAPIYYLSVLVDTLLSLLNKHVYGPVFHKELTVEFTPSRMKFVTSWRYFNNGRAAKLLGYRPPIPLQEGMRRAVACRPDLRREEWEKQQPVWTSGRTHRALGGGSIADLVLWRRSNSSLLALLLPLLLLWRFTGSEAGVLADVASVGFYILILCFAMDVTRKALTLLGRPLELPPLSLFQIAESPVKQGLRQTASLVNKGLRLLEKAARGRDLWVTLKVTVALWLLSEVATLADTATLFALVYSAAFVLPILYDKYEDKVDKYVNIATTRLQEMKRQALHQVREKQRTP